MPLFHVCRRIYQPGDIKPAGTYWAALIAAGFSPTNDHEAEFLREASRAANYPHLPSRARSSFAFETLTDARHFRDHRRCGATVYSVDFVDTSVACFRVTWSSFQSNASYPISIQIDEFWQGKLLYRGDIEVFAESDLRVLAQC